MLLPDAEMYKQIVVDSKKNSDNKSTWSCRVRGVLNGSDTRDLDYLGILPFRIPEPEEED